MSLLAELVLLELLSILLPIYAHVQLVSLKLMETVEPAHPNVMGAQSQTSVMHVLILSTESLKMVVPAIQDSSMMELLPAKPVIQFVRHAVLQLPVLIVSLKTTEPLSMEDAFVQVDSSKLLTAITQSRAENVVLNVKNVKILTLALIADQKQTES